MTALHTVNKIPDWRSILGKTDLDSRQKDVELILRFFGLLDLNHYQQPMKDFLSKFMKANRDLDDKVIEQFRTLFTKTVQVVANDLGPKPFHIRGGLNSAVLDSVMVSFATNLSAIPSDIKERYGALIQDKDFLANVSTATTNEDVINNRFRLAQETLFKK